MSNQASLTNSHCMDRFLGEYQDNNNIDKLKELALDVYEMYHDAKLKTYLPVLNKSKFIKGTPNMSNKTKEKISINDISSIKLRDEVSYINISGYQPLEIMLKNAILYYTNNALDDADKKMYEKIKELKVCEKVLEEEIKNLRDNIELLEEKKNNLESITKNKTKLEETIKIKKKNYKKSALMAIKILSKTEIVTDKETGTTYKTSCTTAIKLFFEIKNKISPPNYEHKTEKKNEPFQSTKYEHKNTIIKSAYVDMFENDVFINPGNKKSVRIEKLPISSIESDFFDDDDDVFIPPHLRLLKSDFPDLNDNKIEPKKLGIWNKIPQSVSEKIEAQIIL